MGVVFHGAQPHFHENWNQLRLAIQGTFELDSMRLSSPRPVAALSGAAQVSDVSYQN
ncbi:hypothetical protein MTER_31640 [Mycolicibacter terrae]|jgi:hypothetical protein|uniref:Uncharacterized protein n=1 Tax=Mycolicibacter terrae TaxID=1788 RepID=A0AAD1HY18_9MYCO|nr:hypothetical protein MTER_31640 [Mycolicibacter terrae]